MAGKLVSPIPVNMALKFINISISAAVFVISRKALVKKEKSGRSCLLAAEIAAYHVESPGDLCRPKPSQPFPLLGSLGAVLGCSLPLGGSEEGSSPACPQLAEVVMAQGKSQHAAGAVSLWAV